MSPAWGKRRICPSCDSPAGGSRYAAWPRVLGLKKVVLLSWGDLGRSHTVPGAAQLRPLGGLAQLGKSVSLNPCLAE